MPKKTLSVEIESSGYDLVQALAEIVKGAKAGGAAGALEAGVARVVAIVGAIEALPADVKEDVWAFGEGAVLALSDLLKAAVK